MYNIGTRKVNLATLQNSTGKTGTATRTSLSPMRSKKAMFKVTAPKKILEKAAISKKRN